MSTKRTIFEDVSEKSTDVQPQVGLIDQGQSMGARAAIRAWMILLFLLVWAMILVGGLTRLTDSGLSITDLLVGMGPSSIGPLHRIGLGDWVCVFLRNQKNPNRLDT